MKIVNYKKKKNNLYELTFDNNNQINLYDDIILKYELLLKKEIDDKELIKILEDNSNLESYYVALKYINSKLRTEQEIQKKLKDYKKSSIEYTIDRLKKEGYLNNTLYIKSYINDEINFKLIGPNKIMYDLKKLSFKENDILDYLNTIDNTVWLDKINKYISKKISTNHNLSALFLKQKIVEDLIVKGFDKNGINEVISNYDFYDNEEIYKKEYNKLKIKLSKKYRGEELVYRIKIGLMKKGFKKNSD